MQLEEHGYILRAGLMSDIALGKMFSRWLRDVGHDPNSFPTYSHEFLDHRPNVDARLYPNELMTKFNEKLEDWLRHQALIHFKARDKTALPALDRVLAALPAPES